MLSFVYHPSRLRYRHAPIPVPATVVSIPKPGPLAAVVSVISVVVSVGGDRVDVWVGDLAVVRVDDWVVVWVGTDVVVCVGDRVWVSVAVEGVAVFVGVVGVVVGVSVETSKFCSVSPDSTVRLPPPIYTRPPATALR